MNEKKIELIQQDIEQINKQLKLSDKNKQFDLINRIIRTWSGIGFAPSKGLVNWSAFYNDRILEVNGARVPDLFDYDWQEDLRQLKNNLEILIEELQNEPLQSTSKMTEQGTSININNNNINSNANIITVTLSQTIQQLEQTNLTKEELAVIKQMLTELENLKGKKKDTIWEKAKKILAWLGDKAFDVGIAVLPYIMAALA